MEEHDYTELNSKGPDAGENRREQTQEELRQANYMLGVQNSLLRLSVENLKLDEMLGRCLELIVNVPFFDFQEKGAIFLVGEGSNVLKLKVSRNFPESSIKACEAVPFGKCICGRAASSGTPIYSDHLSGDHDIRLEDAAPHGHYAVPIMDAGTVLGVLIVYIDHGSLYSRKAQEFLNASADTISGMIVRKRYEEKLARNEAMLVEAQRIARLGSWEWNMARQGLYWSEEVYRIFGLDPGRFTPSYELFLERIHPEDRLGVQQAVSEAVNQNAAYNIQHRILRPDGSIRWVHERANIYRDEAGNPVKMLGTVHDITEIKTAEQQLKQYRDQLESLVEERSRDLWNLKLAVEQSPVSIVITDYHGTITYVNPGFCRTTGYSAKEALGENPRILKSGRHSDLFYEEMWKTIQNGRIWRGEICNRKKSGDLYWEHAAISRVLDEKGETISYIAVKEDITWKKELETWKADAEKVMRHDLKTPLNSIIGFPRLLMDTADLTDRQKQYCRNIEHAGRHMLEMIDRYLSISRIESGQYECNAVPVHIVDTLKKIFQENKSLADARGINLELTAGGILPEDQADISIQGEEALCYGLFMNLVKNAVEASPENGTVRVDIKDDRTRVSIAVQNQGTVPVEIREHFFEKFISSGKEKGTGIGTYSAKLMTEIQGGMITMQTSQETGTIVTVTLPS